MAMLQDRHGFIWFGTQAGLCRYDGYRFKTYLHDPNDSTSISGNWVMSLLEDSRGAIWVGTFQSGLNRFDPSTEVFTRYTYDARDTSGINDDDIFSIYESRDGVIWLGTFGGGINRLDPSTGKFAHFVPDSTDLFSINDNEIWKICEARDGTFWIGTWKGGLNRFDRSTGKFRHFVYSASNPASISDNEVLDIYEDKEGYLWVTTNKGGLNRFDPATERFERYGQSAGGKQGLSFRKTTFIAADSRANHWVGSQTQGLNWVDLVTGQAHAYLYEEENPFSIGHNFAWKFLEGQAGEIWVGSWVGGVSYCYPPDGQIEIFRRQARSVNSLSDNKVLAVHESRDGLLWIGTDSGGLDCFDPVTRTFTNYRNKPSAPHSLSKNEVASILEDSRGNLWVGTAGGGLDRLDRKTGVFRHYQADTKNQSSICGNHVQYLYEDSEGVLWVAIYGNGLSRYRPESDDFINYKYEAGNPNSLSSNLLMSIGEDRRGYLWVGTNGEGLNRFDKHTGVVRQFKHNHEAPNALSDNIINCIYESRSGQLWVGTQNGLNTFDPATETFRSFHSKDGLAGDAVFSIIEDGRGNIWLSTSAGLCFFNPGTEQFVRFTSYSALGHQNNGSFGWLAKQGDRIALGGENGLKIFHPDSLELNPFAPAVAFTDFHYFQEGNAGGTAIAVKGIAEKKEINLSYDDYLITVAFTMPNYFSNHLNQFAYQLEGFHDNWIPLGTDNKVTFTKLPPGNYTLKVKGANGDGVWTKIPATLRIHISPPWWASWWAYPLYGLLFTAAILGTYRFLLNRRLAQAETERLREIDKVKTKLYTNISHEFRTPLTVILGVSENEMVRRNARQVLSLVNQMLALNKLESGSMKPNWSQGDVVPFLKYLLESFHSLAERKRIALHFQTNRPEFVMDYDPDKMQHILSNLLSNAIKFTPEGGEVTLSLEAGEAQLKLTVSDTGIGIESEQLPRIFDRFYQVSDSNASGYAADEPGTGIGLSIAREMVELLGGSMKVDSEPGKGSCFTVVLPVHREAPVEANSAAPLNREAFPGSLKPAVESSAMGQDTLEDGEERPLVLIIEDHSDVRAYLRSCLESDYQCLTATNGSEGIATAIEYIPDIIVSDVMMPEKDGFEVCRHLKADERTSHIPIVLLTARADTESKFEGLEGGADVYLTKPFIKEELLLRLRKLIELRQQLQARYAAMALPKPGQEDKLQPEDAFLNKLRVVLEENMDDESFGIAEICSAIGISRMQLHRKIKALTGKATSRYIRSIRLHKALQLLLQTSLNISEIAYEVGFRNHAYFSATFLEEFGLTPKEARENGKQA